MYLLNWARALADFKGATNGTLFQISERGGRMIEVALCVPNSGVRPRVRIEHGNPGRGLVVTWLLTGFSPPGPDGGPGELIEGLGLARAAWAEFLAASPPLGGSKATPWKNGAEWRQGEVA